MSNSLTFKILSIISRFFLYDFKMTCAKLQGNWFKIDGEIHEKLAADNCVLE